MQKTPFSHASRIFTALAAVVALFLLTGCELTVTNLTPDTVPANPSQIYTLTVRVTPKTNNVLADSIQPRVIIDGQSINLHKGPGSVDLWEVDYQLPAGRGVATYYFIIDYGVKGGNGSVPREFTTDLQTLNVSARYVLRPEATRAPVGARVSVLGAGFTPRDVVYFDQSPTRTVFESPSSLSFFVPAVEPAHNYQLHVTGGGIDLPVGTFRVDAISFQVTPEALTLQTGEQQAITFTIPNPAPAGGMLVDVSTDVAESIVMPEVMIAAGATSVTVPVQGGKPGTGHLYFKTSAGESSIPVTVTGK